MKESQYIKGWLSEGELKGAVKRGQADLFAVLSERIADPVPEEVRLAVEGTNDLDTLQRWLRAAARSNSWPDFRAAMKNGA
jgi:hypothetical protein